MNLTLSSEELERDPDAAKRATDAGPVFITEQGHTTHVLMSIGYYRRLATEQPTVADMFAMPGGADVDIDFDKLDNAGFRPAEFD